MEELAMKRGRGEFRRPPWKTAAAVLVGIALLGLAGMGVREILRSSGGGALVTHGPFLVPRSLIFSGIPSVLPPRSKFTIRNSPFEILSRFFSGLAFAQPWDRQALGFFKADITGSETITTVAGTGTAGFSGDGGPATSAQLNHPRGLAFDGSRNLFIADSTNHRIRKVAAGTGIITTVAGTGTAGFNGDNMAATSAQLRFPVGVALDASGDLFIADSTNHRIRKVVLATGIITTVAGSGPTGSGNGDFAGDGGPATSARLDTPFWVAFDASGDLFIADVSNNRVRKVDAATGIITTVAGSGPARTGGFSGDGGPATSARFDEPDGFTLDASGNLFIADANNNRVRKVAAATGIITTVAGTGPSGFSGDGGPATSAQLSHPSRLALDASGNLFIVDDYNQ
jgi:sugar lactone lactonase YvrE